MDRILGTTDLGMSYEFLVDGIVPDLHDEHCPGCHNARLPWSTDFCCCAQEYVTSNIVAAIEGLVLALG